MAVVGVRSAHRRSEGHSISPSLNQPATTTKHIHSLIVYNQTKLTLISRQSNNTKKGENAKHAIYIYLHTKSIEPREFAVVRERWLFFFCALEVAVLEHILMQFNRTVPSKHDGKCVLHTKHFHCPFPSSIFSDVSLY